MSDQELGTPQDPGVDDGASVEAEVAESTADESQGRQPEKTQQPKHVDLTQFDEFRQYQANVDRRQQELMRELQQQRQEAERIRQEFRQKQLAEMDDYERAQYERDEVMRERDTLRHQLQMQEVAQYRQQQIMAIRQQVAADTGVQVPFEAIDASDPQRAVDSAWRYAVMQLKGSQSESVQKQARQLADTQQAHRVDLGGGAPQTVEARYRAKQRQLVKEKAPAQQLWLNALQGAKELKE